MLAPLKRISRPIVIIHFNNLTDSSLLLFSFFLFLFISVVIKNAAKIYKITIRLFTKFPFGQSIEKK